MKKDAVDFDDFAENYREIHTESMQWISGADSSYFGEYKVKIIREGAYGKGILKILDLGCGDGMNSIFFNKYFDRMKYYGIDVSEESIKQAGSLTKENVQFSTYDGAKIPFEKEMFDIILISCVLHHVPHAEHFNLLLECMRVLKNDGCMYIFEHNPVNPVTRKIVNDCIFDKDAVLVKKNKLVRLLNQIGYKNVQAYYTVFFPHKGIFKKLHCFESMLKWVPLGGQYYIKCQKT